MTEMRDLSGGAALERDRDEKDLNKQLRRLAMVLAVTDGRVTRNSGQLFRAADELDKINDKLDLITWHLLVLLALILMIIIGLLLAYAGVL